MIRRYCFKTILILVPLAVTGCYSMSRIAAPVDPSSNAVELRLDPARTVTARGADGRVVQLDAVRRAQGSIIRVQGDSVTMRVQWWSGSEPVAEHDLNDWADATVSTADPGVSLYQNKVSMMKNLLLLAGAVGLVALAIGQASVA